MNSETLACKSGVSGFFIRLVIDVVDTAAMIRDWFAGEFDWSPKRLFVASLVAALYVISPIDIVPDWIPLAGWIDDILVISAVVRLARTDLERYRRQRG